MDLGRNQGSENIKVIEISGFNSEKPDN